MGKTPRRSASSSGSGSVTPAQAYSAAATASASAGRPSFPSISLKSSPSPASISHSSEPKSARSSLLNVLSRPHAHHTQSSPASGKGSNNAKNGHSPSMSDSNQLTPEDEFSDYSTISSYASSVGGGGSRQPSSEELAKMYKNYLETPFVSTKQTIKHSEYGHCNNPNWRWTSQWNPSEPIHPEGEARPPYYVLLTTYISYLVLIVVGHVRDFLDKKFAPGKFVHLMPHNGYAALNSDFDSFYTRRLKQRMDECFSRPVTGVAGRTIVCLDRSSKDNNASFQLSGTQTRSLNVSSYNYLGFASSTGGCADAAEASIRRYGVSGAGPRHDASTTDLHVQTEKLVARFVGTESALVGSMGFATNSTTIPALVGKGCLIISDEFNHASIRFGARLSGASVRWFKHNDMEALEQLLREVISQGQPRTHRPWKKILLIVEGLYSMEGSLVNLPHVLELKRRYKFYLYVDEAHSIGALGPNGRGVCDYFGVDPREIDVLMGTFTKSFGAAGGYVAGTKSTVDRIRLRSHACTYSDSVTAPVLAQILASMGSIMGIAPPLATPHEEEASDAMSVVSRPAVYGPAPASSLPQWMSLPQSLLNGTDGRERLRRLAFNSRYLASGLRKLGFMMYGHRDSPIIPLLIFHPAKMHYFSQMMTNRVGPDKTPIVVVVVAYPATPLISSRVRFCLSSSHTKNDIDLLLRACDEVGDILKLKYAGQTMSVEQVIASAEELVAASF